MIATEQPEIVRQLTALHEAWEQPDDAATLGQVATTGGSNENVVVTLTGAPLIAPKLFVRVAAE